LGLPQDGFVFCSFNHTHKFTPEMFAVWMRILRAVEGSVLWLPEGNELARRNLSLSAQAQGVAPERLVFAPFAANLEDHLARLGLADLFLDTLPHNAHTTASDALWAGLPILTCKGSTFAGRVAASLLHAMGLPELVTESLAVYEEIAVSLAHDSAALAALRVKLARNRIAAPLFDTAKFTRGLEAAYTQMRARSRRGETPQSFAVGEGGAS
jgi:predicted O-linked N-acetylglucosamine transferase (SPINDLY family)